MMGHFEVARRVAVIFCLVLAAGALVAGTASAEIVDDVVLKTDANGEVDAVVKFTIPVRYIRHFPQQKSAYVVVYFDVLNTVAPDQWQNYEEHRSPPSDLIEGFTVSTRDLNTGPKIEVRFKRPVDFTTVREGKEGRSIVLHIKPQVPLHNEGKSAAPTGALLAPAAGAAGAAKAAAPAAGVAGAAAGAALPAATPAPAVKAAPAAAVQPVTPSAAQPPPAPASGVAAASAPVEFAPPPPVQSLPVTSATVPGSKILPATTLGPGLPPFPALEIPPSAPPAPTPGLPLAEQIRIANGQAALLMLKARDAIFGGRMFEAVEALNNVLKLPTNRYTEDAQLWVGIAREKGGQADKARLEFELYLKLYPNGSAAPWVKERLALLNRILPPPPPVAAAAPAPTATAARPPEPKQPYQNTRYGSLSMYYYNGNSQTNTVTTVGTVQTPTSLTATDQSSLITNVMATDRFYNNENEVRLVLQDFYSKNFLKTPGATSTNRLNALYGEWKDRTDNAYFRVGRQSAIGGGVMGRFDGAAAGYGTSRDWRLNVVGGQLSDQTLGPKPIFYGASLDFGLNDPVGGSFYGISQKVNGITDRKAVGGTLRYFDPQKTALAIYDYDTQFRQWNMVTLQGTVNDGAGGATYNFLVDRRRSPSLNIRNAVNGTTASITTLLQNGWTTQDLIDLAKLRNAVSNTGQAGVMVPLRDKLQSATDIIVTNTSGMQQSGTLNPDGTTGLEGFVGATQGSGNAWTLSQRLIANDLIANHDVSMASVSFTKSRFVSGKTLMFNNHSMLQEAWWLDPSLRFYWQTDSTGGKVRVIAPALRVGYRIRNSLTLESEGGVEWTRNNPSVLISSRITRKYFSLGFRWDF